MLVLFPACKKPQEQKTAPLESARAAEPTPPSIEAAPAKKTAPPGGDHPAGPTPSAAETEPTAKEETDRQPAKLQPYAGGFDVVDAEPVYLSNHGSGTVSNSPPPISPTRDGTYILLKYKSVTTDSGIFGLHPGEVLRLLHDNGASLRVTNGKVELDVEKDEVTNDEVVAQKAVELDEAEKAKNTQWGKMQQELARKEEEKRLHDIDTSTENAKKKINGPN
jgi:hypothetical protein